METNNTRLTDNETIKALECCIEMECSKCPLNYEECEERDFDNLVKKAIPIFNRQKAEVERLQDYYDSMQAAIYEFREDHAKVKFFKKEIKAEAVKEFAHKIESYKTGIFIKGEELIILPLCDFEDIKSEMVGEDK